MVDCDQILGWEYNTIDIPKGVFYKCCVLRFILKLLIQKYFHAGQREFGEHFGQRVSRSWATLPPSNVLGKLSVLANVLDLLKPPDATTSLVLLDLVGERKNETYKYQALF